MSVLLFGTLSWDRSFFNISTAFSTALLISVAEKKNEKREIHRKYYYYYYYLYIYYMYI